MMSLIEVFFTTGVEFIIHILEIMGIVVICVGAVRDFIDYFTGRDKNVKLDLAESMALGLEFMLGGEILRTVIAHEFSDILLVGAIIVLRVALTLLIHWESSHMQHGSGRSIVKHEKVEKKAE